MKILEYFILVSLGFLLGLFYVSEFGGVTQHYINNVVAPVGVTAIVEETIENAEYHPTMDLSVTKVTWVRDDGEIAKAFEEYTLKNPLPENSYLAGLAHFSDDSCTIYAYEPINEHDIDLLDTLGHELLHCFRGDWHD